MDTFQLQSLPAPLQPANSPVELKVEEQSQTITLTAGQLTDLFVDPQGQKSTDNAPRLTFAVEENFTFSAKVTVNFQSTFDAGVLLIYAHNNQWAKLCFEYSPQQQPMIVSVVTRQFSDDCNSVIINDNQVYLRIAKINRAFAFHYSADGQLWHLVRHFNLASNPGDTVRIGFSAQSPTGQGCRVIFSEINYSPTLLADIRNGQ